MISEGSCDAEDWSNDAKYSEIYILQNKIKNVMIFHNITVFTIF